MAFDFGGGVIHPDRDKRRTNERDHIHAGSQERSGVTGFFDMTPVWIEGVVKTPGFIGIEIEVGGVRSWINVGGGRTLADVVTLRTATEGQRIRVRVAAYVARLAGWSGKRSR